MDNSIDTNVRIAIRVSSSISVKIEKYILDLYARRIYDSDYDSCSRQVNNDIRSYSSRHDTTKARDIKAFLLLHKRQA